MLLTIAFHTPFAAETLEMHDEALGQGPQVQLLALLPVLLPSFMSCLKL